MESFKDLRAFAPIKDSTDESQFTDLLKHIYNRHKVLIQHKNGEQIKIFNMCYPIHDTYHMFDDTYHACD